MLPTFDIEGGVPLALARGLADAGLLGAFGAPLFRAAVASPVLARMARPATAERRLREIAWLCLLVAGLGTAAWLALVGVALGGTVAAVPAVLRSTVFGHVLLLRAGLLGLEAVALAGRRAALAAALAGVAVATQAGHGHAFSMHEGPSWLLVSEELHLLAAGAWLGGLLPLLVLVGAASPGEALAASRRFSALGTACVIALAGTALFQSSVLVGGSSRWIGTAYGLVALAKAALFLVLLGFAARNRFRLTPALAGPAGEAARGDLLWSIAGETLAGLAVVLAAGLLTSLPPAMHEMPM